MEGCMSAITYLKLQPSELAVFEAASRIFASRVVVEVGADEDELMKECVLQALKMAKLTDKLVQSDSEHH
jgi:hypothetical protein